MEQQPMTFNDWQAGFERLQTEFKHAEYQRNLLAVTYADLCLDVMACPVDRDFAAAEYSRAAKALKAAHAACQAFPSYSFEC